MARNSKKKAPRVKRLHITNVGIMETKGYASMGNKFMLILRGDVDGKEVHVDLDLWDASHIIEKLREKLREAKKHANNLFDSAGV